ncbi:hypothetical protein YWIDRAFT_00802 [Streptomyces sp. SceaMP-e96]|uniref:hypothetical protein n=1 Tax=unclassified Streptomyces TaxID=2593676 RepID=UPI0008239DC6|nr:MULTISPECIES: hypothetical protein [unclassified Streptomyces]MYT11590.1 hypothetical protein [Streptomyces sp. SID4951]SCK10969.1 hypothetical protein YWIDRAFT_00802 [Streptomyces sp. SceaMP-e96]
MGLVGGSGYQLEPEAFEKLTKGIKAATAELKELGFDVEAQLGRGFDRLALDSMECGDDGLAAVMDSFCDRWGWGVRTLMQDANEFSKKLGITAGMYYEQEQYVSDTLKQTVNAAMGDPSKTAEELHNTSWAKIGADNPFSQVANADFDPTSKASMDAHQRVAEGAQQFSHDVTSVPDRIMHGGEDPADVKTEFHEPKGPQGQGGNSK